MSGIKNIFSKIKEFFKFGGAKKPLDTETIKKVLGYIGKHKIYLAISTLLALTSVALTLYVPILIGDAIDEIGNSPIDINVIINKLLLGGILILFTALANWLMNAINNRISYHVLRDVRNEAFGKIGTLPLSYIDKTPHGDVVNRVINDTDRFAEGLLLAFTQVFTGTLTILGTLIFMLVLKWEIALTVVLLTPLSLIVARYIGKETYHMHTEKSITEAEQASFINESIGNQKLLRAFGREEDAISRFNEIGDRLEKCSLRAIFFSSLTNPTTRFVNSMVYAAVAIIGAFTVIRTAGAEIAFTVGQFSVMLSYTNQYTKPFNEISGIFAEFQSALASAKRVFDFIEEPSELEDTENALEMEKPEGALELSGVSFSYDKEKKLIENLNVSVKPGQRIAIVGPTGCGKTTLINLLMRFYDVDAGEISVDTVDIKQIKRKNLRKCYGMVLQDTWLRHDTIRNNIAFGSGKEGSRS